MHRVICIIKNPTIPLSSYIPTEKNVRISLMDSIRKKKPAMLFALHYIKTCAMPKGFALKLSWQLAILSYIAYKFAQVLNTT